MKDLYTENYETLLKETEDKNKWKDILCSWIGRINTDKVSILPKAIYRFNAIPIKTLKTFFTEMEQKIVKCIWNHRRPWRAKATWKKEQSWKYHTPWSQTILQNHSNQNIMVLYIDQWNRIESPEINSGVHGQLIYNKEYTMEKEQSLQ